MLIAFLALPALPAAAAGNSGGDGCGRMAAGLAEAMESGGYGAMAREMQLLLSGNGRRDMGLEPDEAVRCAVKGSGDVYLVVNTALAAGISRDAVRRGIERYFSFDPMQMPDLGFFETAGRLRVELNAFGGVSIDNTVVGQDELNKEIELNGGGGYGGGLTIGYGLTPRVDLDLAMGYHVTYIDPKPSDGDGRFERWSALLQLKYRLYSYRRSWVKFGIGGGYFVPVRYKIEELDDYVSIEYKDAPGGVASIEYEAAVGQDTEHVTFVLGLRYLYVEYEAEKVKTLGGDLPVTDLPKDILELDGSSAELTVGLATYF